MEISTDEITRVDNNKNNDFQYLTKIISNYSRLQENKAQFVFNILEIILWINAICVECPKGQYP